MIRFTTPLNEQEDNVSSSLPQEKKSLQRRRAIGRNPWNQGGDAYDLRMPAADGGHVAQAALVAVAAPPELQKGSAARCSTVLGHGAQAVRGKLVVALC